MLSGQSIQAAPYGAKQSSRSTGLLQEVSVGLAKELTAVAHDLSAVSALEDDFKRGFFPNQILRQLAACDTFRHDDIR